MKKIFLAGLCLLFMGCLPALAQRYKTAAGVRIGNDEFGGTIQQKILEKTTLEGMVTAGTRQVTATLLAEQHFPVLGQRFNYYMGGGVHGGHLKDYGTIYGFDVIGGLEYKVNGLPFLLSADLKPAIHLRHEDWLSFGGAFSIRYVLIKEKPPTPGQIIKGIFSPSDKKKKKKKESSSSWF
ncbi:hypothetical protein ACFSC6_12700 [Rufibacter sediminis]|uniref:DUF3575 domain-containing protein n=1 Tax=Rufibacter sediminis TaxID=2762756 RepID=A0ABR6VV24_9BACT|nr:hypothetical protein [Rufibacter sediminis]MBC3540742.1 hypothetical protein [Rufibacter sediminis]